MSIRWNSVANVLGVWLAIALTVGCGPGDGPPTANISAEPSEGNTDPVGTAPRAELKAELPPVAAPPEPTKNLFPEVLVKTSVGDFRVRLDAEKAPETVENFLESYVDRGFYSGTIFHHVDQSMVIAGGFAEDLTEKEVRAPIRNEAAISGLQHKRGTIAMFRLQEYTNSATSQFFINLVDNDALNYDESADNDGYCVFGEVIEGMDVLDGVAKAEVHESDGLPSVPVTPIVIRSIERIAD